MLLTTVSTAEAEYVAISEAAKEALYLRKILAEFKQTSEKPVVVSSILAEFKQTSEKPVVLFEDNSAAAIWTKNETDHQKSRHIDVRYHHIRDHIAKGDIVVHMCPTQEMVADIMTKALDHDLHRRTAWRMMGHLPEMAHPQHAKRPMSTPKPISKPVAERIKRSESTSTTTTRPVNYKSTPIQPTLRHANLAAQAIDIPREPARCPVIRMQGPPGSDKANTVVRREDRPVYHYHSCKGNPTLEEANAACVGMFEMKEVQTEFAANKYWETTYQS